MGDRLLPKLRNFIATELINKQYSDTATDISLAICDIIERLILTDDEECNKVTEWGEKIRELRCPVIVGQHNWVYDQCGYWAHQYCSGCMAFKYPELGSQSCSEVFVVIGNISESDYVNKNAKKQA